MVVRFNHPECGKLIIVKQDTGEPIRCRFCASSIEIPEYAVRTAAGSDHPTSDPPGRRRIFSFGQHVAHLIRLLAVLLLIISIIENIIAGHYQGAGILTVMQLAGSTVLSYAFMFGIGEAILLLTRIEENTRWMPPAETSGEH